MSSLLEEIQQAEMSLNADYAIRLTSTWIRKSAPLAKPAPFCNRMYELEKIYGLHKLKQHKENY